MLKLKGLYIYLEKKYFSSVRDLNEYLEKNYFPTIREYDDYLEEKYPSVRTAILFSFGLLIGTVIFCSICLFVHFIGYPLVSYIFNF